MATTPSANVSIDAEAGALAGGTGYCVVFGCPQRNADLTPRVFASSKAFIAQHGYCQAADYIALHIDATKKPVIFVGIPVATAGVVGRQDASGVTGSSVITVAAGSDGYLEETSCVLVVTKAGTIGTSGIEFDFSADGGRTFKKVKLGTRTTYAPPYLGIVISFAAGTLAVDDEYTFTTTAPMWDVDGMTAAKAALAAQKKPARSWMVIEELANSTFAGYVTTAVNSYETANKRFVYARAQVRDRLPLAEMSRTAVRMSGAPNISFAEVGGTGDTVTRSSGSFVTDGFVAGMAIDVSGSGSNNFTKAKITAVTATVLTLDTQDLIAEGPVAGVSIVGSPGLTFAEVGGTGDTITRAGGGSFLDDGFRAGDTVTIALSASNNVTGALTAVTSTVLTFGTTDLAPEFIGSKDITITKGETMAAYVSTMDTAFASIDDQKRIDLGLGRGRKQSLITGWKLRRPVQWAASIREYQHDVHIPCWRKEDGALDGWDLEDEHGNVVEYDQDVDGGALEARFTCFRTWGNGPNGAFIAQSVTRADESTVLSMTHNMAVANVCCTIVQSATENFVGKTPQVDDEGHIEGAALGRLEEIINPQLEIALLIEKVPGEGPRASRVVWKGSANDVLNVPDATLTGAADLRVNGTIVHVDTAVKVG